MQQKHCKGEFYSDTGLLEEIRMTSYKNSNFTPSGTRKKNKAQTQQKEGIRKIRAEINEVILKR